MTYGNLRAFFLHTEINVFSTSESSVKVLKELTFTELLTFFDEGDASNETITFLKDRLEGYNKYVNQAQKDSV